MSSERQVVIVGGGLVGSLLAVFLKQRGLDVTVYERRPDIRTAAPEAGRSINLVLTRRGIRALERVGLADGALALTVPVTGRMMHAVDGALTYQPYGKDDTECNYSIPRAGLNEYLVRQAADRGVRFRFRSALVEGDPEAGRWTFEDESSGERTTVDAPVVFGADGAGSAVRRILVQRGMCEESVDMLRHGYKELSIPPAEGGGFRIDRHALHIWPRGEFMLMALPNLDGSFTVTLYLPYEGTGGFDTIRTDDDVERLFREYFADAIPLIDGFPSSFFDNPTGELGTVRCDPWRVGGRCMLIGDAAHAIVPFFGQGMNTGFEDCTILGELLDERDAGWAERFAELQRRRKPHADAIADMALENFVEMRDKVADARFLLRKQVEHRLEREMPDRYRSRYSMVMYSHIPFAVAFEVGRIQQAILDELCRELASADAVDLELASRLIADRLSPFLSRHAIHLDY